MQTSRPVVKRPAPPADALQQLSGMDPVLARVFATRGITSAEQLEYGLAGLAPVSQLDNVDAGVDLLLQHRDQRIVVVGDFDVDGATSTALMLRCLRAFGFAEVDYLVPNRFEFGYGLSPEIVAVAAESEPALLITVDNGISSVAGVARAQQLGIPVLVTDHHLPAAELPAADVIINPNLPGSQFPSRNLAGVGVAFYLLAALGRRLAEQGDAQAAKVPARFLDLVALGTVADVVPLDYNNRILVQQGLARIRAGHAVAGIRALLELSRRQVARTVSTDLGFVVGPRLNAAGRLEDMSVGIECLLTDDLGTAQQHAALLDGINKERREIESSMRDQAFAYVDAMDPRTLPACVTVYNPAWHQGVVGLVAARVRERCHRPVIAFARESDGILKGSARSISGVHVRDLLEAVSGNSPGLIRKFGGHAMAAGLSLDEALLPEFKKQVVKQMQRLYPAADFSGAILTDGGLPGSSLTLDFARTLRNAGPWGSAFPEPLWQGDFTVSEQRTVGETHLKMRVQAAGGGALIDAIAFNQAGPALRGVVQLAYRLDVNEFRGVESPQLVVEQIAVKNAASTC
ncbi:MAG: single-stranded-DNA-specific exonuclease RecJ [Woeseiaceae bacterium]